VGCQFTNAPADLEKASVICELNFVTGAFTEDVLDKEVEQQRGNDIALWESDISIKLCT
jgi:hypothetical protein